MNYYLCIELNLMVLPDTEKKLTRIFVLILDKLYTLENEPYIVNYLYICMNKSCDTAPIYMLSVNRSRNN